MIKNSRKNHSPTSALAGRVLETSGTSRLHRAMCLDFVIRAPSMTAREIEDRLGIKAHKRLPELRLAGLVRNGPVRACTVTGRQAMTWLRNHRRKGGQV